MTFKNKTLVNSETNFTSVDSSLQSSVVTGAMEMDVQIAKISLVDRTGISLSLLCTIHCILLPVLTIFLPFLGHLTESSLFHWAMAVFVIPLGVFAFVRGYRIHHIRWILAVGFLGMGSLVLGLLLPDGTATGASFVQNLGHHSHDGIFNQEAILTMSGSLLLAVAHISNLRNSHHVHLPGCSHEHDCGGHDH